MKRNFDHLYTAGQQVGVIISGTGFITGMFYSDQLILTVSGVTVGMILIWAASPEN